MNPQRDGGGAWRAWWSALQQAAWAGCLIASSAAAHAALPARSAWTATSSASDGSTNVASKAIDGDIQTRWSSPSADGHWLSIDLGASTKIGGAVLRWEPAYAVTYTIEASNDGQTWRKVYATVDGRGGVEYVFFPTISARHLRLTGVKRATDWGVSLFEFEPLADEEAARVAGLAQAGRALWRGAGGDPARSAAQAMRSHELVIELGRELEVSGVEVFWASPRRSARLSAGRQGSAGWNVMASDKTAQGRSSFLAARQPVKTSRLLLTLEPQKGKPLAVDRLRLLSPSESLTPLKQYEIAAARARVGLFPMSLLRQQVFWTTVGVAGGLEKSLLDEYGNLEAKKGAPLIQPVLRTDAGRIVSGTSATRVHSLRHGWMPMPAVEWSASEAPTLRIEAFATGRAEDPATWVRYRLRNTGIRPMRGRFYLAIRPMQVNPAWQYGGIAPLRSLELRQGNGSDAFVVDGRVLATAAPSANLRAATALESGDIANAIERGVMPARAQVDDADGLASGALGYDYRLDPGQDMVVVLMLPLIAGDKPVPLPPDAAQAFDTQAAIVEQEWKDRLERVGIELPDRDIVDALRAQVAYMLLNQTGHAMQPGPRNYNRSFLRDGASTAGVLLRMGMPELARDYLRWFTEHAVHANGLVSPILNTDGSVNTGFGSDLEHDSQGEYVALVADVARLGGGAEAVREYLPQVRSALQYLVTLRERTLVPGYFGEHEAPQRFRGILAPSISHEGYSTPHHSYWDDFWALKGWQDGAWLADTLGDKEMARWARGEQVLLRDALAASVRATMAWKQLDTIPASADLGDPDPTSVSIALEPTEQHELLPQEALARTFDNYFSATMRRHSGKESYAYTPYELRNVLSFVRLNQPARAAELLKTLFADRRPHPWHVFAEVARSDPRRGGYIGDMPHTWVGAEYVRAVLGMLYRETTDGIELLPGTPGEWLAGQGARLQKMPTAFGALGITAKTADKRLIVEMLPGLVAASSVRVWWPARRLPSRVVVDGREVTDFSADSIRLAAPFKRLEARWQ